MLDDMGGGCGCGCNMAIVVLICILFGYWVAGGCEPGSQTIEIHHYHESKD